MPMIDVESDRHQELAAFLRSRRARLAPEQVGLPHGTRRRTPGLRRAEVAQLAGVSTEWYTWLEQGRDIHASVQVVERLAKVLQMDATERAHLFLLTLRQPPPVDTYVPPQVSPNLQQFIDQLRTIPVCVVDARLQAVAWNAAQSVVFDYYFYQDESERNLIWRLFTTWARQHNERWKELARVYLAQFRAGYGRFINDPWWANQIAELSRVSPEFRELWSHHDVHNVTEGRKTMHHDVVGMLDFDYLWLQTVDSPDLRMLIHTPRVDTDTSAKIEQLLAREAVASVEV